MAFVLVARGPENVDAEGNPTGTTPAIVEIDGSRPFLVANTVSVATPDADVEAVLEAAAPPGSKQRLRWIAKANTGGQATPAPGPDWTRTRMAEADLGPPVVRALVGELWTEVDALRAAAGLAPRTMPERLEAVRGRLNGQLARR